MVLGRLDRYNKKLKLDQQLTPYTRIDPKCIRVKYKSRTIKILGENIGSKISAISRSNFFADIAPRERDIKDKIHKWDCLKLKTFCMPKEIIDTMKMEPSVWENIFANETSDKGLISKIDKELIQTDTRKTNNPIKIWTNDLNRHFFKETNEHMKKCISSVIIREMQVKTTLSSHLTLARMATINKSINNKGW